MTDFQFPPGLFELHKSSIVEWLREQLKTCLDEDDEVFLEYITVMISNGKAMGEIKVELLAFLGEEGSEKLSQRYSVLYFLFCVCVLTVYLQHGRIFDIAVTSEK